MTKKGTKASSTRKPTRWQRQVAAKRAPVPRDDPAPYSATEQRFTAIECRPMKRGLALAKREVDAATATLARFGVATLPIDGVSAKLAELGKALKARGKHADMQLPEGCREVCYHGLRLRLDAVQKEQAKAEKLELHEELLKEYAVELSQLRELMASVRGQLKLPLPPDPEDVKAARAKKSTKDTRQGGLDL